MNFIHSSKQIIGSKASELSGRKIVLCVCGSVAACRAPQLARELMRLGASVKCVMSASACKLVCVDLLWWATGEKPITELTGECEHVSLCGQHAEKSDLVLVAPATANTVSKIACGIDDTPITTVVSTAVGSKIPIVIVPAMHASLYEHPIVAENLKKLEEIGVIIVQPRMEEGKAKIAENEEIIDHCLRALSGKRLSGKRVLVTAGATREFIDDVRFISNPSSGRMGIELAREAWVQGAEVLLVHGHVDVKIPRQLNAVKTISLKEMRERVLSEKFDVVFMAAAPADFGVKKIEGPTSSSQRTCGPQKRSGAFVGKISSKRKITLELQPLPKIAREIRRKNKNARIVLFKAESGVSDAELEKRARKLFEECSADFVVANDVAREGAGFEVETNEVIIVGRKKKEKMKASKREIAGKIIELASS